MSKTITQPVTFKGASAKDVYAIYMNAKKHAEATGSPAAEQGLRGATDGRDAWVLFVEGTDAGLLSAACREVLPARTLVEEGAAPGRRSGLYRMLVTLRHEEA